MAGASPSLQSSPPPRDLTKWTTVYSSTKPTEQHYTVILKPQNGFDLTSVRPSTLTEAVMQAANLTPTEIRETILKLRPTQNLAVIDTFRPSAQEKLVQLQTLRLQQENQPVSCYSPAPAHSCKGVIHGVPALTTQKELIAHLHSPGPRIITARMMGKSESVLITFEGTYIPYHILYHRAEYRCRPHRPRAPLCYACLRIGHRSEVCTLKNHIALCENCCADVTTLGDEEHRCSPFCHNCSGDHPPTSNDCPARNQANAKVRQGAYHRRIRQRHEPTNQPDSPKPLPKVPATTPSQPSAGRPARDTPSIDQRPLTVNAPTRRPPPRNKPHVPTKVTRRSRSLSPTRGVSEPTPRTLPPPSPNPQPIYARDSYRQALGRKCPNPASSQHPSNNSSNPTAPTLTSTTQHDSDMLKSLQTALQQLWSKLDRIEQENIALRRELADLKTNQLSLQALLRAQQKRKTQDQSSDTTKCRRESFSSTLSECNDD